jgi:NADPH:quinone reductase-like Zn-dependent oxidoreductase
VIQRRGKDVRVETMRAIVQQEFGGPEVLRIGERPRPEPVATEVRVRVEAAGVNPVDWKTRSGKGSAVVTPPFVPGWDVAGVVDAVGAGVTRFQVGDPVFGLPWFPREAGAYAEYVTAPSRHFARRPAALPAAEGAALALAGLTAWQCLVDIARVQPGQRVLVHAAAGGVGHLAVQIAKARGAHVIGTASAGKHELLASLGVDQAVDYRSEKFEDVVAPVDVVYDLIGGDTSERSLEVLQPDGIMISLPSAAAAAAIEKARARGLSATGMLVEPDGDGLEELAALVESGRLRVIVAETFPLERAADAHRLGEQGRTTGKIVLTV